MAELARRVGLDDQASAIEGEFLATAGPALRRWEASINWPTRFTAHRAPVEVSLAVSTNGSTGLRWVVDCTDYERSLAANLSIYRAQAELVWSQGEAASSLGAVLSQHLDGCPASPRFRMLHGVGYTNQGSRGTLYFSTNWLSEADNCLRFPHIRELWAAVQPRDSDLATPLPPILGTSYDADRRGCFTCSKVYFLPPVKAEHRSLLDVLGHDPNVPMAEKTFSTWRSAVEPYEGSGPVIWSVSSAADKMRERIGLACPFWGWETTFGLGGMLERLATPHAARLITPFLVLSEAGILATPSVMSFDSDGACTLYLIPTRVDPSVACSPRRRPPDLDRRTKDATARATDALTGLQDDDGTWSNHVLATALISGVLAGLPRGKVDLAPTRLWLQKMASLMSGSQILPLVHALGWAGSSDHLREVSAWFTWSLLPARPDMAPEDVASLLRLLSWDERPLSDTRVIAHEDLMRRQRPNGSWEAKRWSTAISATADVASALHDSNRATRPDASDVMRAARGFLAEVPARADAHTAAAWATAWLATGGDRAHPSMRRALRLLCDAQDRDGLWHEPSALHVEASFAHGRQPGTALNLCAGLLTTAVVMRCLTRTISHDPD